MERIEPPFVASVEILLNPATPRNSLRAQNCDREDVTFVRRDYRGSRRSVRLAGVHR